MSDTPRMDETVSGAPRNNDVRWEILHGHACRLERELAAALQRAEKAERERDEARAQAERDAADNAEMALLLRRAAFSMKDMHRLLSNQIVAYLKRKGLTGNPLRDPIDAAIAAAKEPGNGG